jgi:hypothetical protein
MGSLWFVDFRLVHRHLGINDMVSIEDKLASRARFNKPYKCVNVEEGLTTDVLRRMNLAEKKAVVWLDHEKGPDGAVFDDVAQVCPELPGGSVLILTVSADRRALSNVRDDAEQEMSATEALEYFAREAAPANMPTELDNLNYPPLLAEVLFRAVVRGLRTAGRSERFRPLFNFAYDDGTPMVTIGGLILNEEETAHLDLLELERHLPYVIAEQATQRVLDVPVLTPREKDAFDQLLPSDGPISPNEFKRKARFGLEAGKIRAYEKVYKHYPNFGEYLS